MAPIEWTPRLLIHPLFDDDHRELIELVNNIEDLYDSETTPADSAKAITALLDRMIEHSKEEEALMHKTAYTRFIPHKIEHDLFITKLKVFIGDLSSGEQMLNEESTLFIRTWIYEHIIGVDKPFAQWMLKQKLL